MTNNSHSSTPTNSGNSRQTKIVQVLHGEIDGKSKSNKKDGTNPNMKELTLMEYQTDLKEKKENNDKDSNLKSDNNDSNNNGIECDTAEVKQTEDDNFDNDIIGLHVTDIDESYEPDKIKSTKLKPTVRGNGGTNQSVRQNNPTTQEQKFFSFPKKDVNQILNPDFHSGGN